MVSTRIHINEFNQHYRAICWIKDRGSNSIIIPLQSLFIDSVPNILPLSYFFPLDLKKKYQLHQCLIDALKTHAPPSLSQKSIHSIANDIHPIDRLFFIPMSHSYQWIHLAISDYQNDPIMIQYTNEIQTIIESIAVWIESHYNELIIFGFNRHQYHELTQLISLVNLPIHWVLPSLKTDCCECSLSLLTHWFDHWSKHTPIQPLPIKINVFESVQDECKGVLNAIKNLSFKIALVAPNDDIKDALITEGMKTGIDIRSTSTPLKSTMLGALLKAFIQWIESPTIDHLLDVLNAWPWPTMSEIKQRLNKQVTIGWTTRISSSPANMFNNIDQDHLIHTIISVTSLSAMHDFIKELPLPFGIDASDHFNFLCKNAALQLLGDATTMNQPMMYILFMMEHVVIEYKQMDTPPIICISPEDIGKVPSHAIWLLGFASNTWKKKDKDHYLLADELSSHADIDMTARLSFGAWGVSNSNLLGVSFATSINDQTNYSMGIFNATEIKITLQDNHNTGYQRHQLIPPITHEKQPISPSALGLYQRCPYAFFIKNVLGISQKNPPTEYQIFGILIHEIIEKIAKKLLAPPDVINVINQQFSPLMATIMNSKIQTEWPMDDIQSFLKKYAGSIETEKNVGIEFNGIQLNGRADLIIKQAHNIEVIDIKSGQFPTSKNINQYDYIQLGIYALMIENNYKDHTIKASLIGKDAKYKPMIDSESSEFHVYKQGLIRYITQLFDGLAHHKYQPDDALSSPKETANQCRVCDYYHICHWQDRHHR